MLHILLLMLLIGGTSQTSESRLRARTESTASAKSTTSLDSGYGSPTKNFPAALPEVDKGYFPVHVDPVITDTLSKLIKYGYFKLKTEKNILTIDTYPTAANSVAFKPKISRIDKDLENITEIRAGYGIFAEHHRENILDQLNKEKIQVSLKMNVSFEGSVKEFVFSIGLYP